MGMVHLVFALAVDLVIPTAREAHMVESLEQAANGGEETSSFPRRS